MKKLFFLILLGLFAYFVWPTRYQHYAPGESPHTTEAVSEAPTRVDRLTGDIAVQETSGAWRTVGNKRRALAFEQPAVDPNATRRPSALHRQEVADQHQRSVQQTQNAVQAATEQQP